MIDLVGGRTFRSHGAALARWVAAGVAVAGLCPAPVTAQLIAPRVASIDVMGGSLLADGSETGVTFGARVAAAELFGAWVRTGVEFAWWTAERRHADIDVRDVVIGLSFWKTLGGPTSLARPYVGIIAGVHSFTTSRSDGSPFVGPLPHEARRLEGIRLGAGGFAGVSLRLTRTGVIRLLTEYRFTAVSRIPHHEVRAGARLLLSAL